MKLTKTAALKGALLTVLAANMSWEHVKFESTELASTAAEAVGSAASATAASAPVTDTPKAHTVAALTAKPAAEVSKPATLQGAAPEVSKVTQPQHSATFEICGEKYAIHYVQFEEKGDTMTRVSARKATAPIDKWDLAVIFKTDFNTTLFEKETTQRVLTANIKEFRSKRNEACGTETASTQANGETSEEAERIAEGEKNCTLQKKGGKVVEVNREDRLECFVDLLSRLDKTLKKKDSNGKRLSEEALASAAQAELNRVQKQIKSLAKTELLSKDESRREEASEQLSQAINAIEDIASVYDLGRSTRSGRANNSISKLTGELSALKHAGETNEESQKYAESARYVRDDMRQSYEEALRNPLDPYARQNYDNAKREYERLRWDIGTNFEPQFMTPLNNFKRAGMISNPDFNEFTRSFADIQKLLKESVSTGMSVGSDRTRPTGTITNSVLGNDFQIPNNLSALRSVGTDSTNRILGLGGRTAAPVINLPAIPTQNLQAPRSIFQN